MSAPVIANGLSIIIACSDVPTAEIEVEVVDLDHDLYDVRLLDDRGGLIDGSYRGICTIDAVKTVIHELIDVHLEEAFAPERTGREE
jgi:hypothetical protein